MNRTEIESAIRKKMRADNAAAPTTQAFLSAVAQVMDGSTGLMPEDTIEPVQELPDLESLVSQSSVIHTERLDQLAVIRLNGGLGTSMGLQRAKSLISVKDGKCFLDFIATQILFRRRECRRCGPWFYLMNSHGTRADSLDHLRRYPELSHGEDFDFLQSRVPKLDAETLLPVEWPSDRSLEWCPPGHGDLYPSLMGCGLLDRLLRRGIRYMLVSNSDNLGATVDLALLDYFAESGKSFLMEVAHRTAADRKGGHLARRRSDGRLVLRESAQTPAEDVPQFMNIERHGYFNTNNLWVRLDHLKDELTRRQGALKLPLIRNAKTVDPKDLSSPKVLQLETAMGAAIECFANSGAVVVPRTRFAPVKTTSDLLALRSDAYRVAKDGRIVLEDRRKGRPPLLDLDPKHYRVMTSFERHFPEGPPSLVGCEELVVRGAVTFGGGVICEGRVEFRNGSDQEGFVPPGTYRDTVREVKPSDADNGSHQ